MVIRAVCPRGQSPTYKKNGHIHTGKPHHQCQDCGRQCVDCFAQDLVSDDTRGLIERLLLERLSLRGMCRSVGVGLQWLLGCIVTQFEALPDHRHVEPITSNADVVIQRLEVEADERASFVQKKVNTPWIWLAMDATTRQIIAFYVGDRRRKSTKKLWAKIPVAYRQQATLCTDQYVVYAGGIPAEQHRAITTKARKTPHIERFNKGISAYPLGKVYFRNSLRYGCETSLRKSLMFHNL